MGEQEAIPSAGPQGNGPELSDRGQQSPEHGGFDAHAAIVTEPSGGGNCRMRIYYDRMRTMKPMRRVAICADPLGGWQRGILEGAARYTQECAAWEVRAFSLHDGCVGRLAAWRPDGAIVHICRSDMLAALRGRSFPVVNTSGVFARSVFPRAMYDATRAGQMAAEHLQENGFVRLAFAGIQGADYSERCLAGCRAAARTVGETVAVWDGRTRPGVCVGAWCARGRGPLGLVCATARLAVTFVNAARTRGVPVPERLGVVACDDDELQNAFCFPSVTAIRLPGRECGYAAARRLDELMEGRRSGWRAIECPPLGVTIRQSSTVMGVSDPVVTKALAMIRAEACAGLRVGDLVRHVPVCRRRLEALFRRHLGRSPACVIRQARVAGARDRLADPETPLKRVAEEVGYADVAAFSRMFKRETGQTPRGFGRAK